MVCARIVFYDLYQVVEHLICRELFQVIMLKFFSLWEAVHVDFLLSSYCRLFSMYRVSQSSAEFSTEISEDKHFSQYVQ